MNNEDENRVTIPDNAYRELKEGEEYEPLLPAKSRPREVTPYSVAMGVAMAVLFSAATAFLGLKVGQVFEAAIPIAIIAVGAGSIGRRSGLLGQNVIIQSIGASSGVVVAGAIFTLPALYILDLDAGFMQIFLSSLLGGFLGILLLIPFRKYFVKEMHGKLPFPEATATTEVLVSGQGAGRQAKLLAVSGAVGGLYDFVAGTFGWWTDTLSSSFTSWGARLAEQFKLVFKINTGAAVLGLGYIVGLKYAAIICAGSFVAWFVLVPLISVAGGGELAVLSAEELFGTYAKPVGIGGIAMAGLIGIIRQAGIIGRSMRMAVGEMKSKRTKGADERTQRDLPIKTVLAITMGLLVAMTVFFRFGVLHNAMLTVVALLLVAVVSFLFTTVAANAIAIVGTNPVSGMTLMTLILTSIVFVSAGLDGKQGMTAAMIVGGVVCTALAMAGAFVTDLKIGYWIGTTPAKQEGWKFLGTAVSAATVAGVIMLLDKTYGFTGDDALVAPQANAMAEVIRPLMSGGQTPWMLYFAGAALALILTMLGVPALAFALGMFIPLELNTPLLVGGLISWFVSSRGNDAAKSKTRHYKGTLIASGFIAGGALMGVVSAVLKFAGVDVFAGSWNMSADARWLSAVAYILLIGYFVWDSMRSDADIKS